MRKWRLIATVVVLVVIGTVLLRAFWPLPPVALIVSRETTYFTEPLNPDGTVNYVAAYNNHVGAGVTPAENMAVPIIEALGPAALSADVRDEAAAALNITFSDSDQHFVPLGDHLDARAAEYESLIPPEQEQDEEIKGDPRLRQLYEEKFGHLARDRTPLEKLANSQIDQAMKRPWSPDELRIVADWLAVNDAVLDRISKQRRPEFFVPMVWPVNPAEVQLVSALDSGAIGALRTALACRAMLRLGRDDVTGAWNDALLMCHLGRLMSGPGSGGDLPPIGLVFRGVGVRIITLIAQRDDLTSAQAMEMLRAYDTLPTAGSALAADALLMRLKSLDFIMQVARRETAAASTRGSISRPQTASFDLNNVMRRINAVYDEIEAAVTYPDLHRRMELARDALNSTRRRFSLLEQRVKLDGVRDKVALFLSSTPAKRRFANDTVVWMLFASMMTDPTYASSDLQAAMRDAFARIALALAAYRADHGQYPSDLSDLAPRYLSAVPRDPFNGDDLHYESDGDGYRVWSVGKNLIDDGGDDEDDVVLTTRT
jgi:hypothetical protein